MSTLGDTSTPSYGYSQSSTYNQVCAYHGGQNITIPAGPNILVTKLWVYFGGVGGSISGCRLCIWSTGSSLLYQSPTFTAGSGLGWKSVTLASGPILTPGQDVYVGWWAPVGSNVQWGVRSSGNWQGKQNQSSPSSLSGSSQPGSPYLQGSPGGYLEYVPTGISYGDGSGNAQPLVAAYYGDSGGVPHPIVAAYYGDASGNPVRFW